MNGSRGKAVGGGSGGLDFILGVVGALEGFIC